MISGEGPVYNPALSPEWRQAVGNPMIYEQIIQQKMIAAEKAMAEQQKDYMQQQAFQKWLKDRQARESKGQPVDPQYTLMKRQQQAQQAAIAAAQAKHAALLAKKKHRHNARHTATDVSTAVSPTADQPAATKPK